MTLLRWFDPVIDGIEVFVAALIAWAVVTVAAAVAATRYALARRGADAVTEPIPIIDRYRQESP